MAKVYGNYIVKNADGTDVDPHAQFLVLRLDTDIHANVALRAYATSMRNADPLLALKLDELIESIPAPYSLSQSK